MESHGITKHPLYEVLKGMKQRCHNKNSPGYKYYGGRGIKICRKWRNDSSAFISWALSHGWRQGLEIDRKDNDKGYSPLNCRFITKQENLTNRRPKEKKLPTPGYFADDEEINHAILSL